MPTERKKQQRMKERRECIEDEGLDPHDIKLLQRCEDRVQNSPYDFGKLLGNL